jgi:hypothetical protein
MKKTVPFLAAALLMSGVTPANASNRDVAKVKSVVQGFGLAIVQHQPEGMCKPLTKNGQKQLIDVANLQLATQPTASAPVTDCISAAKVLNQYDDGTDSVESIKSDVKSAKVTVKNKKATIKFKQYNNSYKLVKSGSKWKIDKLF